MSVSITVKNWLKAKIQSCDSVQVVYGYEEVNPTGWPAVMLTTQDMEGEFSSTSENSRVYSYKALILFPIGQDFVSNTTINRLEYAENVVATVIDEIINAIDTDFDLTGIPQATALYANASDCIWSYTTYEGGEARSAEITVSIYTEKEVV